MFSASIKSVTEAAKQLHDSHIGKGRVFHLFRMQTNFEEKVFQELITNNFPFEQSLLENKNIALQALHNMAKGELSVTEGPIHVGVLKNPHNQSLVETLSQYYYEAFNSGKKVFPYFTAD